MANKIKIKRGTKASLPTLDIGELGLATDTYEVFVGTSDGNKPISGAPADVAYLVLSLDARLTHERQLTVGESLTITDGGPNGAYTINTVQDIRQTAIPRFAGFEVYSEAYAYTTVRAAGTWSECGYTLQRARGTLTEPQAVASGDTLGYVQWMGYTGSSYKASTLFVVSATQNWGPSACGSRLRVYTTPNDSGTEVERLRVDHDGVVYIYSTASPCLSLSGGLKIGTLTGALFASSGTVSALAATAGSQYLRRNAGNTAYEWATLDASDLPNHASRHVVGGADPITGNLDANARVGVRLNSGGTTYTRRRINFIAGSGISFSFADDPTNEEVDLTVTNTGGGGGAPIGASYVVMALDGTLTSERQLAVGASLTMTDGGANSTVTLNTIQDIRTTATPTFHGLELAPVSDNVYVYVRSDYEAYHYFRTAGYYWPKFLFQRARGSLSSPTNVSADVLGAIHWEGYYNGQYRNGIEIIGFSGTWATDSYPTTLIIRTTQSGYSGPTDKITVGPDNITLKSPVIIDDIGSGVVVASDKTLRASVGFPPVAKIGTSSAIVPLITGALTTLSTTANTLRAIPIFISSRVSISGIRFRVAASVSGNARIGIYDSSSNGYPYSLLAGSADIPTNTTGVKVYAISPAITVGPGLYWLALVSSAAVTVGAAPIAQWAIDPSSLTTSYGFISVSYTYAALPSYFPSGAAFASGNAPILSVTVSFA